MHQLLLSALALLAGAGASPCPPASPPAIRAAADPAAGFNAFPPCIEVEWEAHDVSGRPPVTLVWKVDGQTAATGPSWIMDTADYFGFHTVTVTATNPWARPRSRAFSPSTA